MMESFPSHHDPKQENSPDMVLCEGYWKHGRFYGSWRRDLYLFPIDEEEMRRLDIFHKFFLLARRNYAFSYPTQHGIPTSVLDLGTGTSIWAIHVAEEILPKAHVTAVDLNRVQPARIPPNMTTVQLNMEDESWAPLPTDYDLVHMRLLLGSIHDTLWEAVYKNAFEHTAFRSGVIQQVEIDWAPRWENTAAPGNSALLQWSQLFLIGMDRFQRSARVSSSKVRHMMEAAGYIEFDETIIRCCVSPWCDDAHEKLVARWFNVGLSEAVEAMSFAPLVEKLGMDVSEVKDLCERLRNEICTLRYHAYFNM